MENAYFFGKPYCAASAQALILARVKTGNLAKREFKAKTGKMPKREFKKLKLEKCLKGNLKVKREKQAPNGLRSKKGNLTRASIISLRQLFQKKCRFANSQH